MHNAYLTNNNSSHEGKNTHKNVEIKPQNIALDTFHVRYISMD